MDNAARSTHERFTAALDEVVAQVKEDRSILAAILCGSLAHDTVWARSDIDLALVTVDDQRLDRRSLALAAAGVIVHAFLIPRAEFRQMVEGAVRHSFTHSLLAKGRLLYTHDPTIATLCAGLAELGERDTRLQLLAASISALPPIDKAHKWFVTRGDLDYTALWILYAAVPLARIEVIGARILADREVIPQALRLNPPFFRTIYTELLNRKKTGTSVRAALEAIDVYLAQRAATLFRPVIDHLEEAGEARSSTEIEAHFKRNHDLEGAATACEYLARQELLGMASMPVRLTRRSNVLVEEQSFVFIGERDGA